MTVYKRKGSPYWQYEFHYRGERYRGSCDTADKRRAEAEERRVRARIEQAAVSGARPEMSVEAALARYLEDVSQHQTKAYHDAKIAERLGHMLGLNRGLTEIDDNAVAVFVAKRRKQKARNKKTLVSNATVNRDTEFLRRVMNLADSKWKVQVARPVWKDHALPEANEREVKLAPESFARLLSHLRTDYHPLFRAARASGIRLTNLTTLSWSQVDVAGGVVRLIVKGGDDLLFPLAGEFAAIVASCRGQHPELVFTYVALKKRGNRLAGSRQGFTMNGWRKFYVAAREAAGLSALRFHDLRHAFGNAMYAATRNIKTVQRAMCHSDVSSTLRYMHSDMDDVITGIEGLAASLPQAPAEAPAAEAEPVIYLKLRRA